MKMLTWIGVLCLAFSLPVFAQEKPPDDETNPMDSQQPPAMEQMAPAPAQPTQPAEGQHGGMMEHVIVTPSELQWTEAPEGMPSGAQVAVMEGDPSKPGPYTVRVKMPDGYKIMPHWHPNIEHVTVVSGMFHMGMGDKFDQSAATTMPVSAFAYMQPQVHHYAWAQGETVVQLHGTGPWAITYVNPGDDPRNAKE